MFDNNRDFDKRQVIRYAANKLFVYEDVLGTEGEVLSRIRHFLSSYQNDITIDSHLATQESMKFGLSTPLNIEYRDADGKSVKKTLNSEWLSAQGWNVLEKKFPKKDYPNCKVYPYKIFNFLNYNQYLHQKSDQDSTLTFSQMTAENWDKPESYLCLDRLANGTFLWRSFANHKKIIGHENQPENGQFLKLIDEDLAHEDFKSGWKEQKYRFHEFFYVLTKNETLKWKNLDSKVALSEESVSFMDSTWKNRFFRFSYNPVMIFYDFKFKK